MIVNAAGKAGKDLQSRQPCFAISVTTIAALNYGSEVAPGMVDLCRYYNTIFCPIRAGTVWEETPPTR
jgi:hypothetical protein